MTDYGLDGQGSVFDIRQRQEVFLFSTGSRPALEPTHSVYQEQSGSRAVFLLDLLFDLEDGGYMILRNVD
jgi:hypothetical protein